MEDNVLKELSYFRRNYEIQDTKYKKSIITVMGSSLA